MKFSTVFTRYLYLVSCILLLAAAAAIAQEGSYPQLDISGFKKWEYKSVDIAPKRNYFSGLTQLGGFYPNYTGGPWQERLQLRILGQLSKELAVTYDLEQQPETPDRFDIKVKYSDSELTFGDFTANFTGNEFASTSKFLNGVMLTSKSNWYDITAVPSAKLKSQTQNLTSQNGNNTKGPYNLGHGSIVEGSERIELNGRPLVRNIDYTIDYFEGKLTFNDILTTLDEFKYTYEYTNILDLFFPSLSKRDFIGFQSRFTIDPENFGQEEAKRELVVAYSKETFPTAGEVDPEVSEKETLGVYQLAHVPIVEFSEKITYRGTLLRKNEEYIINYHQGQVKLLTRFLPTEDDLLIIEYRFNQTSQESETIFGIDSRGPYQFIHNNLVPQSERIEVNGKLKVRDLDYTVNYESGEIVFSSNISQTSQIKASYKYNVSEFTTSASSKFPKSLKVGTTYLRESAKQGAGAATATIIEEIAASEIINYTLYLSNRPLVSTDEASSIIVKLDGRELTRGVDYVIPVTSINSSGRAVVSPEANLAYINDPADPTDGFGTGTIKIISTPEISATSEVTVTYNYYKSIVGKYSGVGDGTRGQYYLKNIRNLVPGTEAVQVWEQGSSIISTYTRNSSFEADAGDKGYAINYDQDNPYITFNSELSPTQNFQVIYQYKPPDTYQGGDLVQSIYGFDTKFEIGKIFEIDTAYAKSETDQVFVAESTSETKPVNGTKTYALDYARSIGKNIIEGSEKVYVNNNLLNKDIDYFITYTNPSQQVTFYYITPTTQDAIVIDYSFQSLSGIVSGQSKKTDVAYKLGAKTSLFGETLAIGGNTKKIGFDFTPMGGTAIGLGSQQKEYFVAFKPDFHSFSSNYSYQENYSPIGLERDRFLRTYDNSFGWSINPRELAKIDFNYRNYQTMDDLSPAQTTHNSDNDQSSYGISLTPAKIEKGLVSLDQKYDLKKTSSKRDTVERTVGTYSDTTVDYLHANTNIKVTERLTLGLDWQNSEPKTIGLKSSSTEATYEAVSLHSFSTDRAYNFSLDLTSGQLQKWVARVSLLDHLEQTLVQNFVASQESRTTRNETYHMDFIPSKILSTAFDHNRQERSSFVAEGANPITERSSLNARLTPVSWLGGGWKWQESDAIPETGATKRTQGRGNSYDLAWNPLSNPRLKLDSRFTWADNYQSAPVGSYESIPTKTDSFSHDHTVNLTLIPNAPISLGYALENYKNLREHPDPSQRIDTATDNETLTAGITITPAPPFSLGSKYDKKTTKVKRSDDSSVTGRDLNRSIITNNISFHPYTWGTLIIDQQREANDGEIQGGKVTLLNIDKVTTTYSLNINFPIDNAVVSSFVVIGSLKQVDYKNRSNAYDDFFASLMTIEGSMNF